MLLDALLSGRVVRVERGRDISTFVSRGRRYDVPKESMNSAWVWEYTSLEFIVPMFLMSVLKAVSGGVEMRYAARTYLG